MSSFTKEETLRVIHLLKLFFDIPYEKLDATNWQKPLTGNYYNLTAVDLVYLLFEVEKEFKIRIPPEFFEDYQFSTINGICDALAMVKTAQSPCT